MSLKRKSTAWLLKEKTTSPLFFLLILIGGLLIYSDYGLAWDASYARERGKLNYNYIEAKLGTVDREHKINILQQWKEYPYHDHGAIFDVITYGAEKLFSVKNSRQAYLLKHLLIFIFFFTGSIFFYFGMRKLTGWKYALTGVLFLVLSPRIFAHAFFNPKDIIFMVMVTISLYTAIRLLNELSFKNIFFHALSSALAIDIRITGLFIPGITLVLLILLSVTGKKGLKHFLITTGGYFILLAVFIICFWPYLWENPLQHFIQSLQSMSAFTIHSAGSPGNF